MCAFSKTDGIPSGPGFNDDFNRAADHITQRNKNYIFACLKDLGDLLEKVVVVWWVLTVSDGVLILLG